MDSRLIELAVYRYRRAKEELENAQVVLSEGRYNLALNRSYYSIFHGIRSVNILAGFDSSKHSGVIAYFNRFYVKTEIFPKLASKIIRDAYALREQADYEDFFFASKKDAELQVKNAEIFLEMVEEYMKTVNAPNV